MKQPALYSSTLFSCLENVMSTMSNIRAALKKLEINNPASYTYVAYMHITPGQLRYSQLNVHEKKAAAIKNKASYNNGKSIIGAPLPVIIAPFGPVLVDGHHDTLASISLGAPEIPVFVIKDLSHLTPDDFWQQATREGLVYPYALDSTHSIPTTFDVLEDDPNRFFAALVARKCTLDKKTGTMVAIASPKTALADYPVWIKFGNKTPFIEFKISDMLKKHGLQYNNSWGESVPEKFVEQARKILLAHPIPGLKVVAVRTKIEDNSPAAYAVCLE